MKQRLTGRGENFLVEAPGAFALGTQHSCPQLPGTHKALLPACGLQLWKGGIHAPSRQLRFLALPERIDEESQSDVRTNA